MAGFLQKTIRDTLLGLAHDHFTDGRITCGITQQVGCELLALLSAYREEGRQIHPEVYLFGPAATDLLNVISPGSLRCQLGTIPITGDVAGTSRLAASSALRTCAPLANDGWAVFIRKTDNSFIYGVFRPAAEPYSGNTEDQLATSQEPVLLFRNSAENTVEVVNSRGGRLEVSLTTAAPRTVSVSDQIGHFARITCSDSAPDTREQVVGYVARVLGESLRSSHGALLAVVSAGEVHLPDLFVDAVVLPEPILLAHTVAEAIHQPGTGARIQLRGYEALLRGMIGSDGITLLGSDGSIRAFRVFVRRLPSDPDPIPGKTTGGARSRAFEVLQGQIGKALRAALFRSHDGRTEVVVQP